MYFFKDDLILAELLLDISIKLQGCKETLEVLSSINRYSSASLEGSKLQFALHNFLQAIMRREWGFLFLFPWNWNSFSYSKHVVIYRYSLFWKLLSKGKKDFICENCYPMTLACSIITCVCNFWNVSCDCSILYRAYILGCCDCFRFFPFWWDIAFSASYFPRTYSKVLPVRLFHFCQSWSNCSSSWEIASTWQMKWFF